jgi:hypothetical protein
LQAHLVSPSGTRVELFANVGEDGDNMTELLLSDAAPTPVHQGEAPFTGLFRPLRPLSTFAGEPANGEWTLEIFDLANGDTGSLLAWSLEIASEGNIELQATTNAAGDYEIVDVPAGTHTIVQQLPPAWEFTHPIPTPTHSVTVMNAGTVSDIDFGNRSTSTGEDAHVIDVRLGSSTGGTASYSIPVGSAAQLDPIALVGFDRISVVFDRAWDVTANSLELSGVNNAGYDLVDASFTAVPGEGDTLVATWALAAPIEADKLLAVVRAATMGDVVLYGDWTNPIDSATGSAYPSGDGTSGGDFAFRFNVLAGDANRDGTVNFGDLVHLIEHGFVSAMDDNFDPRHDLDGNGIVNVVDVVLARNRLGTALPTGEPGGSPIAPASPTAAGAVVQRAEMRSRRADAEARAERSHSRNMAAIDPYAADRSFAETASSSGTGLRGIRARRALRV